MDTDALDSIPMNMVSRWRLLKVLAGAKEKMSAAELNVEAFDGDSNEESVRHHIRKLRDELKTAFPGNSGIEARQACLKGLRLLRQQ
jgi:DNA-binding response OmpR family regulator